MDRLPTHNVALFKDVSSAPIENSIYATNSLLRTLRQKGNKVHSFTKIDTHILHTILNMNKMDAQILFAFWASSQGTGIFWALATENQTICH